MKFYLLDTKIILKLLEQWVSFLEGSIYLIETKFDAKALKVESFKKPLAYITQTTLIS